MGQPAPSPPTRFSFGTSTSVKNTSQNGERPEISVGLPVHNGDRFLEQALRSVLSQTWSDLELIVLAGALLLQPECRQVNAIGMQNSVAPSGAGKVEKRAAEEAFAGCTEGQSNWIVHPTGDDLFQLAAIRSGAIDMCSTRS